MLSACHLLFVTVSFSCSGSSLQLLSVLRELQRSIGATLEVDCMADFRGFVRRSSCVWVLLRRRYPVRDFGEGEVPDLAHDARPCTAVGRPCSESSSAPSTTRYTPLPRLKVCFAATRSRSFDCSTPVRADPSRHTRTHLLHARHRICRIRQLITWTAFSPHAGA